jgi:ABC-type transport system substrate-binding protein
MQTVVKDYGIAAKTNRWAPRCGSAPRQVGGLPRLRRGLCLDSAKAAAYLAKSKNPAAQGHHRDGRQQLPHQHRADSPGELKELGIELAIEKVTDEELTSRQFSGKRDYDLIMGGWGSDYPDPAANVYPFLHSANSGEEAPTSRRTRIRRLTCFWTSRNTLTSDAERADLLIGALKLAAADAPTSSWITPSSTSPLQEVSGYTMSPVW